MIGFYDWLLIQKFTPQSAEEHIKTQCTQKSEFFSKIINSKDSFKIEILTTATADIPEQKLATTLDNLWDQYLSYNQGLVYSNQTPSKKKSITDQNWVPSTIIFLSFILAAACMIYFSIEIFDIDSNILNTLSNTNHARGLVTSLFAVATVILSLILVLSTILSRPGSEEEYKYRKERFSQGKEVLALLLGIFGTIVGYYFGTETKNKDTVSLAIEDSRMVTPLTKHNDALLYLRTSGGTPPYKYTISFPQGMGFENANNIESDNGTLFYPIKAPSSLKLETNYKISIFSTDNSGNTTAKSIFIELSEEPKST